MDSNNISDNIEEIQKFNRKENKISKEKCKGKFGNKDKMINNCYRCGKNHKINNCPAFGQTCHKCGMVNHYSKKCKSKSDHKINEIETVEEEKQFFIDVIGERNTKDVEKCWNCRAKN